MKKLTINKMNEYPTINLDEQKMIKGGGIPWSEIIKYALQYGLPAALSMYSFYASEEEKKKGKGYGFDASKFTKELLNNDVPVDSVFMDSITTNGAYGVKVYGRGN